jgi:AmmeMemoRadiSam system protein B/AmmeMemoRadiSam system protein A
MNDDFDVRKPAVAGMFYPDNPVELTKQLALFYSKAKKLPLAGRPLAIVAPHAGYTYSGQTAADVYKQLEGQQYDSVVVISPSHTVFFQGASVYEGGAYQTPLGVIKIDRELTAEITDIHPLVYASNKGHTGGSVRGEHALEVHLPFLQQILGSFRLVAVVMGDQEEATCRALGEVLASVLRGRNCLIVASTDLSHFHSEKEARQLDGAVKEAIEEYNPDKLLGKLSSGQGEACGGGPVAAAMIASKKLGGERVTLTGYTTSGAVTGDFSEVVGYLSALITAGKRHSIKDPVMGSSPAVKNDILTDDDKKYLKELARKSIEAAFENREYKAERPARRILTENRGAFVTLKIRGMLRGCIGLIRAARPLYETVIEMAREAAFADSRFVPLSSGELQDLEIEISALSRLVRIEDISEIEIGRDGLMIVLDMHSGLLLPQVAVENDWNRMTFLEQTCLKAGLPKNSYKDRAAQIYRFTADVF